MPEVADKEIAEIGDDDDNEMDEDCELIFIGVEANTDLTRFGIDGMKKFQEDCLS
jgi:hypothetical protein